MVWRRSTRWRQRWMVHGVGLAPGSGEGGAGGATPTDLGAVADWADWVRLEYDLRPTTGRIDCPARIGDRPRTGTETECKCRGVCGVYGRRCSAVGMAGAGGELRQKRGMSEEDAQPRPGGCFFALFWCFFFFVVVFCFLLIFLFFASLPDELGLVAV